MYARNYPQKLTNSYDRHSLGVTSVSSDSSGNIGLSCSQDGSIHVLDLLNGITVGFINAGPCMLATVRINDFYLVEAWSAIFSPDDEFILSGTLKGQINVWHGRSGLLQDTIDTHGQFLNCLAFVSVCIAF